MGVDPISAAVVGGTSLLGGIMGSQKSGGGTQSTSSAPWSAQQPYLSRGFDGALDIMDSRTGTPLPTQYFAGQNGMQTGGINSLYNAGSTAPGSFAPWQTAGNTLAGNAGNFSGSANQIASNGIGERDPRMTQVLEDYALSGQMPGVSGADPRLASAVTGAATTGLGSVGSGQTVANQVAQNGLNVGQMQDQTVVGANKFINNDVLNGQIDAVGTDIRRNLTENTLPQIRQAAMASGNVNSSREGALEAIAGRGAQENLANASANLRGQAYNTGLTTAAGQIANGNATALGAANSLTSNGSVAGSLGTAQQGLQQNQGQFDATSRLGAATGANTANLGWDTADTAARLGGTQLLGNGLTTGINASNAALNGGITGAQAQITAGGAQQQQDQQGINNTNALWQAQDQRQQNLLEDYWKIVGQPMGTQSTATSQPNNGGIGGALSGALGGLSTGLGLYKNYGDMFGGTGSAQSLYNSDGGQAARDSYNFASTFNNNPYVGPVGSGLMSNGLF